MNLMRRNTTIYLASTFFGNLDFSRGVFVLFLLERGVSPAGIGLLQTTLFWVSLLADIPTGLLADRYRRKYSVIAGYLAMALAALLMTRAASLATFAALFALQGLSFALRSGATDALLYDSLKHAGDSWQGQYIRLSSTSRILSSLALGGAIALGPLLRGPDWGWTYRALAIAMILAALVLAGFSETRPLAALAGDGYAGKRGTRHLLRELRSFCSMPGGRSLLVFICVMALLEAAHTPFFIYMQVELRSVLGNTRLVGLTVSAAMLLSSFSYLFVGRLEAIPLQIKIGGTFLAVAALLSCLALSPGVLATVTLFLLINTFPNLLFVFTDKYINDQVPSAVRATYLSIHSVVTSVAISGSYLATGFAMERISTSGALALLGLLPLAGFAIMQLPRLANATKAVAS